MQVYTQLSDIIRLNSIKEGKFSNLSEIWRIFQELEASNEKTDIPSSHWTWGTLRGIKSLDGVKWDPEPRSSMDEI